MKRLIFVFRPMEKRVYVLKRPKRNGPIMTAMYCIDLSAKAVR